MIGEGTKKGSPLISDCLAYLIRLKLNSIIFSRMEDVVAFSPDSF